MMAVLTYLALSLFGLAVPLIVLRITALSHPIQLEGKEHTLAVLEAYNPDLAIEDIVVSTEQGSALASLQGDSDLVVVGVRGDRFVVRLLGQGSLRGLARSAQNLVLILDDYSWPRLKMSFPDQGSVLEWASRAQYCLQEKEGVHA